VKEKILKEIFSNKGIQAYAKKVCNGDDFHNDLVQELYIYLNDKDENLIVDMYNKKTIYFYIFRIMYYSWNSATSPFYKKYKATNYNELKHFEISDNEPQIESDMFDYAKWINKIEYDIKESWYNNKVHTEGVLMLKYLELGSYREVEKEMGISYRTVQSIVQRYAKKLKDE